MHMEDVQHITAEIVKTDASRRLVFGFAIVSKVNGEDYFDLHGHNISEEEVLNSSLDFAKSAAPADAMHDGRDIGTHPFIFPLTTDIAKALGIKTDRTGLLIGQQVDEETFKRFESGELKAFSIEGKAIEEDIND